MLTDNYQPEDAPCVTCKRRSTDSFVPECLNCSRVPANREREERQANEDSGRAGSGADAGSTGRRRFGRQPYKMHKKEET